MTKTFFPLLSCSGPWGPQRRAGERWHSAGRRAPEGVVTGQACGFQWNGTHSDGWLLPSDQRAGSRLLVGKAKNQAQAIDRVKLCPNPMPGPSAIEIRLLFEAAAFGEALTPDIQEQEERIRRGRTQGLIPGLHQMSAIWVEAGSPPPPPPTLASGIPVPDAIRCRSPVLGGTPMQV